MNGERCILHSDMNAFYASVEMMLNPQLKGKAVAVCGATEDRHGIVLAKSDLAKKAGVKTGMVNWEAQQRCPNLILVPPQYDQYKKYSELAHQIYYRYTDLVEPFGMDECWLDVTGSTKIFGSAMDIAESIRKATREELGLTVSIGVSFNKIFAKLGSDMKKPDAITEITKENFRNKVWSLSADELLYVGRSTFKKLQAVGINTIGDLANSDPYFIRKLLGIHGDQIRTYARGEDQSRVMHKDYVAPIKSVGHGITCTADLINNDEVWTMILELSQDVGHRLKVHELKATGVQIDVRCKDLSGYQFQTILPFATQLPLDIAKGAYKVFREKYHWQQHVRALCVRAINVRSVYDPEQLQFDTEEIATGEYKKEHVQNAIEEIRYRFGKSAVTMGELLKPKKLPYHYGSTSQVKIPGLMYQ